MNYSLFSADDHVDLHYLPPDLWQKRVPAAFRERAPRIEETPDGKQWVADRGSFANVFSRVPKPGQVITFGNSFTPVEQEEGRWRPTTPELRLADMDRDGVEGQVLYGGLIKGFQQKDPELNGICMRAYNDWIAEFSSKSPKRLIGLGFLPVHDGEAAAAELLHCARAGLKGVQFAPFDCYKPVWDAAWDPLWAVAAETGLPVSFHVGGGTWMIPYDKTIAPETPRNRGAYMSAGAVIAHQLDEVLTALVFSGALECNPKLQVVLAESSIGWIPYVLNCMDRKYKERSGGRDKRFDAPALKELPSFYWHRQCHATFQDDPVGIQLIEHLGRHTVHWASDYPHTDSVWPHSRATVEENLKDVDEVTARMVLRENTQKLYGCL